MQKTVIFPISLPRELGKQIDQMAKKESMTRSEYVRSVVRRQIAFAGLNELRIEASKRAKKVGIRTLQDSVRAVRELRNSK